MLSYGLVWAVCIALAFWTHANGIGWLAIFLVYFVVWNALYFTTHSRADVPRTGCGSEVLAAIVTGVVVRLLGWWT